MSKINKSYGWAVRWSVALILVLAIVSFLVPSPVHANPSITNSPPTGTVGVLYNFVFSATCEANTCSSWSIQWSGMPAPGLQISQNSIYGTPTTAGTYTVNVTVTDSNGSTNGTYYIVISNPALVFSSTSLGAATTGQPYSAAVYATGGTGTITYALSGGALPSGLTFANGQITGTPAKGTVGIYTFTVTATAGASSVQQSFSITVQQGTFEVLIGISGLQEGQTKLYVNNALRASMRGGDTLKIKLDSDSVASAAVDSIVSIPSRTDMRYKAESNTATLSEGTSNIYFNYYPEYNIELKSDPAGITSFLGSGWYRGGVPVNLNAPDIIAKDAGSQYKFSHWLTPAGEMVKSQILNVTINQPGTYVAVYKMLYKLAIISKYGEVKGDGWYESGSTAKWSVDPAEVSVSGFLGFFGGKYKTINTSGTVTMDAPKEVNIAWETDYVTPAIFIIITLAILGGAAYGIYLLAKPKQPAFAPYAPTMYGPPPPPPPTTTLSYPGYTSYPYMAPPVAPPPPQPAAVPPPQTTVVMIGDGGLKKAPQSTREQLMEKFGELLQKYEEELAAGRELGQPPAEIPEFAPAPENKSLPAPEIFPPIDSTADRSMPGEECGFASKKLLRTVVTRWRNTDIKPITVTPGDKKSAAMAGGRTVTWIRETYNEWELHTCKLRINHKGTHKGTTEVVYSLLNTITEQVNYGPKQPLKPPIPHYTDGIPEVEISAGQMIPPDQLPA